MTNKEIMKVAMEQSALESGCKAGDFLQKKNIIVKSVKNAGARKYLELPFICDFTSYGNNIVASVNADLWNIAEKYLNSYPTERMFETPVLIYWMMTSDPMELVSVFSPLIICPMSTN